MPWTALGFLVGAVAICGLPPLNGFVSEFLVYLGLFGTLGQGKEAPFAGAAFAAPALALIGALAVACFVKVFGIAFLGSARSEPAGRAYESPATMTGPLIVLAGCCLFIGLAPLVAVLAMEPAVTVWAPELAGSLPSLTELAPLGWLTVMAMILVAAFLLGGTILWKRLSSKPIEEGPTWSCGYAAPRPRMQYTSSSFAQMLVGLFGWALRPKTHRPAELPLFPQPTHFHSEVNDPALDDAVLPACRGGARLLSWCRVFQQGSTQTYLLYIFITLFALLLWR